MRQILEAALDTGDISAFDGVIDGAAYVRILRMQQYARDGVLLAADAWKVALIDAVAAVDGGA